MGYCKKFNKNTGEWAYLIFRLLIGLLFFQHGAMKMFGWFGASGASGFMWVVGLLELLAGIAIFFGFWTRLAGGASALLMLIAYFKVHAPTSLNLAGNGGEMALIYFAAFLVLMTYGAGKWSLEKKWFKKELF